MVFDLINSKVMIELAKEGFGRIKFFQKSRARLYIPQKVIEDSNFPFKDNDIVKIRIENNSIFLEGVEWWEMIDWETQPEAYAKLPEKIKSKIRASKVIRIESTSL